MRYRRAYNSDLAVNKKTHGSQLVHCVFSALEQVPNDHWQACLYGPWTLAACCFKSDRRFISWNICSSAVCILRCVFPCVLLQEPCCKLALLWLKLRILDYLPVHGNPRYYQCLLDEDMVRRIKAICTKLHTVTFSLRSLQHYCVMVSLRWAKLGRPTWLISGNRKGVMWCDMHAVHIWLCLIVLFFKVLRTHTHGSSR